MNQPKITPKWLSVVFSVILPGLGQIFQRRFRAGIYILIAFATSAAIVIWYGNFSGGGITSWLVIPVLIWLWNIFNVAFFPKVSSVIIPLVLWLILAYGVGGQVTEFDIPALFANAGRSQTMINEMFNLDFTQPRTENALGSRPLSHLAHQNPLHPGVPRVMSK